MLPIASHLGIVHFHLTDDVKEDDFYPMPLLVGSKLLRKTDGRQAVIANLQYLVEW